MATRRSPNPSRAGQTPPRPPPQSSTRPPQRVNVKTPCMKYGSDSLACKEYELTQLRSSSPLTRRSAGSPVDPTITFGGGGMVLNIIGDDVAKLEAEIEKKSWRKN